MARELTDAEILALAPSSKDGNRKLEWFWIRYNNVERALRELDSRYPQIPVFKEALSALKPLRPDIATDDNDDEVRS